MSFLCYILFTVAVVAADQFTKYLTLANIPLHTDVSFIPGFLGFTYVRNYGAAFSSFQGQQWLFALIFLAFTLAIIWEYYKSPMGFNKFERWCIAAIYAGGLGNMIDRIRFGYVVDMIETLFMDFPVFNVADCCVVCGGIAFCVYYAFFYDKLEKKEEKPDDHPEADG